MQNGDTVKVVGYDLPEDHPFNVGEPEVNGKVGTVTDVNSRTTLVTVELDVETLEGTNLWMFFPEEVEKV